MGCRCGSPRSPQALGGCHVTQAAHLGNRLARAVALGVSIAPVAFAEAAPYKNCTEAREAGDENIPQSDPKYGRTSTGTRTASDAIAATATAPAAPQAMRMAPPRLAMCLPVRSTPAAAPRNSPSRRSAHDPRAAILGPMAHPAELPPPPEPPEQLGEAGRRYWQRITARYSLTEAEETTLQSLCTVIDRIAALDKIVDEEGVIDSAGHLTGAHRVPPAARQLCQPAPRAEAARAGTAARRPPLRLCELQESAAAAAVVMARRSAQTGPISKAP